MDSTKHVDTRYRTSAESDRFFISLFLFVSDFGNESTIFRGTHRQNAEILRRGDTAYQRQ